MKIIFVTREGYCLSGARVRCYNFARALRKLGLETEVYSFADNLGAPCGERELGMGVSRKLVYSARAIQELRRISRGAVFYIQRFNYHSLAPLWISLFDKNGFIFDCDDWNIREDPVYYFGFYPSSKMEFCTRRMARHAVACIAASAYLTEYLAQFSKTVYCIPTGVDTDLFRPALRENRTGEVRFSWIGTAYHEEMRDNLRFILDCFSHLASRFGNIRLSLAGEGRYFSDIRHDVSRSPYRDRIRIDGWIAPEKIPGYLEGMDVGLLPLIQDTKFNRAKSPTKLFENMAMAKPSVSSSIGETQRIIIDGENGMLARSRDEFIGRMEKLIENPELRRDMGVRARQTAERDYSLQVLCRRLYDIVVSR